MNSMTQETKMNGRSAPPESTTSNFWSTAEVILSLSFLSVPLPSPFLATFLHSSNIRESFSKKKSGRNVLLLRHLFNPGCHFDDDFSSSLREERKRQRERGEFSLPKKGTKINGYFCYLFQQLERKNRMCVATDQQNMKHSFQSLV